MNNNIQSDMRLATRDQIRQYFMECLDDGQPHRMAEINTYIRARLAESNVTIPGKYGDYINVAIQSLLSTPGCPYRRTRHGIYQKGDPSPQPTLMDPAHELLNRCFELNEYAQQFFSRGLPCQDMAEEELRCYAIIQERVPQLLDELLTQVSTITAMVEERELAESLRLPKKDTVQRRNHQER